MVFEKNAVFCRFWSVFCSCFVNPFFLILPIWFVGYCCFCFFFTCSCCCFINQVSMFWFLFLLFFCFLGFVMCYLWDFWGGGGFWGFKGQMRWPFGAPHLALNPPYLFFFGGGLFCFSFFFVVFGFGGFKGQVRWPEGRPHLALNPPHFFCFFFFGGGGGGVLCVLQG